MDIRRAAPALAKQVPLHVANARSTTAGAAVDADEELARHLLESSKVAAQTVGQEQTKDGHSKVIAGLKTRIYSGIYCGFCFLSRNPCCQDGNRLWIDRDHVRAIPLIEFAEPVSDPNEFGRIS